MVSATLALALTLPPAAWAEDEIDAEGAVNAIGTEPAAAGADAQNTEAAIEAAIAAAMAATSLGREDQPQDSGAAEPNAHKRCKPDIGCVTNLPLPRFVTLKGDEGNARRGPGLTHRIDWVFTRPGMPLKITAEYDNWRRVEDMEGAGGWVHYALLSGVRSVLVISDMVEFRDTPSLDARVNAQAELGVVARVQECQIDWCRISVQGERGWVPKTALWGVAPGEIIE